MQLEREAAFPLRVGHLEQIDLRHRARDVEKRVDAAERGQGPVGRCLRGFGLPQVGVDHLRFRVGGRDRRGRLLQTCAIPRDQDQRGEVASKADGGGSADALAGSGDDGD